VSASPPSEIEEAATRWAVRMHSDQVTREDERAFTAWLAESEAHRASYDRQVALWAGVGALRDDPSAIAALQSLRSLAPKWGVGRRQLLFASAAGAAAIGGGWFAWRSLFASASYQTAVGEQRRIILSDGSAVTLNTDSALRVRFDTSERRLWLDRGQAFFAVERDAARPFRVFVGEDEVRAIGTAFDIRRQGDRAQVTLEEGVVAVYRNADQAEVLSAERQPDVVLRPNEQVVVAPTAPINVAMVDARRTGAWRFGQMVLESEPLSAAVAEINRYNARQIVIGDPSLNSVAINGVFQTGRPETFVEALTVGFPVEVSSEDDRTIVLARRPP
jgi:transmembrane sensor